MFSCLHYFLFCILFLFTFIDILFYIYVLNSSSCMYFLCALDFFRLDFENFFPASKMIMPLTTYLLINLEDNRQGLPWWCSGQESACRLYIIYIKCREHGFDSGSRKIPHALEQLSSRATTTEPTCEGPRAAITEPVCLEPVSWNKRSHCNQREPKQSNEYPDQPERKKENNREH